MDIGYDMLKNTIVNRFTYTKVLDTFCNTCAAYSIDLPILHIAF